MDNSSIEEEISEGMKVSNFSGFVIDTSFPVLILPLLYTCPPHTPLLIQKITPRYPRVRRGSRQ